MTAEDPVLDREQQRLCSVVGRRQPVLPQVGDRPQAAAMGAVAIDGEIRPVVGEEAAVADVAGEGGQRQRGETGQERGQI
jgi:hypothetical protein